MTVNHSLNADHPFIAYLKTHHAPPKAAPEWFKWRVYREATGIALCMLIARQEGRERGEPIDDAIDYLASRLSPTRHIEAYRRAHEQNDSAGREAAFEALRRQISGTGRNQRKR